MPDCRILTGSVTQAMKAKRILSKYSILAEVVKSSSANDNSGCVYGISFSCAHMENISRILHAGGIPFKEASHDLS